MSGPLAILIGPPGAGKTTVAAALAERLGVTARDTDADVEAAAGMSVADIFVDLGEERFRELEREAVARALDGHDGVLSLGGGAPIDPVTRELLRDRPVAFLDVSLAAAAKRIGLDAPRPLLLDAPRASWKRLMEARRPVYEDLAVVTVDTSSATPGEIADAVITGLRPERAAAR